MGDEVLVLCVALPPVGSLAWVPMNNPLLDTSRLSWKGLVLEVKSG